MTGSVEAIMEFYVEAGVDLALDDAPHDRFAEAERARDEQIAAQKARAAAALEQVRKPAEAAPPAGAAAMISRPKAENLSAEAAIASARADAKRARTLEELRDILSRFEGCGLKKTAKNLVFSDGNPEARLMLVGEAPGRDEDIAGKPFVGRSGQLLDKMLAAIGLTRDHAYIANVIPWRPPGNRTPSPQETEICRVFIERQIELADPDVLVLLGAVPANQILQTRELIGRMRGKWRTYHTGAREIPVLATLHPAYLLRQAQQKRLAWRDFLEIKARLALTDNRTDMGNSGGG